MLHLLYPVNTIKTDADNMYKKPYVSCYITVYL